MADKKLDLRPGTLHHMRPDEYKKLSFIGFDPADGRDETHFVRFDAGGRLVTCASQDAFDEKWYGIMETFRRNFAWEVGMRAIQSLMKRKPRTDDMRVMLEDMERNHGR